MKEGREVVPVVFVAEKCLGRFGKLDASFTVHIFKTWHLLPTTWHPYPPTRTALPFTLDVDRRCPRTSHPAARHPDVVCSGPSPIPSCPDIFRPGGNSLLFHLNGRWVSRHDHLSTDYPISLGADDLLPGFGSCCRHDRLSFTGGQEKRSHCNETQFSIHNDLSFCIIRFWDRKLVHPTSKSPSQPCAGGFKAVSLFGKAGR